MPRAKKAPEAPSDPLDAMLARLKLTGIREGLDSLLDEAGRANLSIREALIMPCEREIARPLKDISSIDWLSPAGSAISSSRVADLSGLDQGRSPPPKRFSP
jgi:hypothetical protein